MATLTLKALHEAIMQSPLAAQAQRLLQRKCSGTTSRWWAQRVLFFGQRLALIATDYGAKEIVLIASPKHFTTPEQKALREAGLARIPERLSPTALAALLVRVAEADAAWVATTKRFAEEERAATVKQAEAQAQRVWVQSSVTEALGVLVAAARRDGVLYHEALSALDRAAPNALTGMAGGRKVRITVTVE